jgi:hypothetical protein
MGNSSVGLIETPNREEMEPTSRVIRRDPLPLGRDNKEAHGASPAVAVLLSILVGLLVFAIIWKIRRTFGMKG